MRQRTSILFPIFFVVAFILPGYGSYGYMTNEAAFALYITYASLAIAACIGAAIIVVCYCNSGCPLANYGQQHGRIISLPQPGAQVNMSFTQSPMASNFNHNIYPPPSSPQQPQQLPLTGMTAQYLTTNK